MSLNKNISSSLLTQIPVFIFSVISGIFVTRLLGAGNKGIFSLFQNDVQFFVLFFAFTVNTGITYFSASGKISIEKLVGMTGLIIITGTILTVLFLVFIGLVGFNSVFLPGGYDSIIYILYLIVSFVLTVINTSISAFFQGNSSFKWINWMAFSNSLLQCFIFCILFLLNEFDIYYSNINLIFIVTLSLLVLNAIIWIILFNKHFKINWQSVTLIHPDIRIFFGYIFSIYLGSMINFMNYKLDIWIVNYNLNSEDLGIYSLAGNIIQLFIMISVVVASVLLPYLSKESDNILRAALLRPVARVNFVFILFGATLLYFISSWLIPIVYGIEFSKSVEPLCIILPGVIFSCSTQLFATYLVAANRNYLNIIATSTGLICTIILDLILIPEYGIKGAAMATTCAYTITFFATFILCVKKSELPFTNYFIPNFNEITLALTKLKSYFINR